MIVVVTEVEVVRSKDTFGKKRQEGVAFGQATPLIWVVTCVCRISSSSGKNEHSTSTLHDPEERVARAVPKSAIMHMTSCQNCDRNRARNDCLTDACEK